MNTKHFERVLFFVQRRRGALIVINRRKDGFIITGHAGYAEPGKDIVCAAVSALTQTFIASVEELTQDKIEYEIEPGNTAIKLWTLSEKAKTLMESFFVGVRMIAEEYPEYVHIDRALKS